ncbi:uncharacterized protein LOC119103144 [Pollicipes pollicipes]|uniref:uncharacterized protein LOC119103144 n=1 Tax=Pollicipes pollicipes TaxID=41117 RepID=UPI001885A21D|nr:uncharacterized protein LOC119103144 [Pollicipes pollicipes]
MKRSSMRTQSTQTEANAAVEVAPPSYLSLSPRTVHKHLRSQGAQTQPRRRGHRALTKSYSEVGGRPSYLRRRPPPAEPVMARAVSSPIDIHPGEAAEPADSLPAANRRPVERRAAATGADRPPSQQEIMIDYKPCERKHPLQKTLSEGEILLDRRARERLATGCVEVSLVGLGGQRESVIEKLTVSESDLLEPSCGRLRALTQVQRLGPDLPPSPPLPPLPPPPPPRDYDDDEFHENLIENLLSEAVPRAESPSSGSESGEAATAGTRDALSPPRSTLTRDSLTESQETVLQAAGDTTPQPLPLPSDSEAGTPCAAEPENGAPSSASGSQPSLAREEARVLRQLDAISSELDHRLASPEELSRLSPPPPPPQLEGWKDTSPAPSYVSSVSEGDDDKRMEKFLMTLNEGFESDSTGQSDERNNERTVRPEAAGERV